MSFRKAALFTAFVAALSFGAVDAFARAGGGSSSGSRGGRTYSAPSATTTAPKPAAPIERSATPQSSFGQNAATQGMAQGAARSGGFFSGALGKGLLGGLLGAGLIGMLFGNGLMGGLGGMMSMLGLVLQIGLILLLVKFAIGFFRRNQQPAMAGGAPNPMQREANPQDAKPQDAKILGGLFGGASAPPPPRPLDIAQSDYEAFGKRLIDVQGAYSAGDVGALRRLTTPEMAGYFEQEITANAQRGMINQVGNVALLQGDLSEAWREPDAEYATVAMRFSLTDAIIERASGRVVEGSTTAPQETTELWTFRRQPGADSNGWTLSAIQQA